MDLQALAASRGLTFNDLAERMDCAKSTIYHWSTGRYSPNVPSILKLCDVLGLTPNQLLGIDECPYARPVFSRLKNLRIAVTHNGQYDSRQLDSIANSLRGKSKTLERYFRSVADAVYNLELTINAPKKETKKTVQQLSLL